MTDDAAPRTAAGRALLRYVNGGGTSTVAALILAVERPDVERLELAIDAHMNGEYEAFPGHQCMGVSCAADIAVRYATVGMIELLDWDYDGKKPCPDCLHPEHLADVCEVDLGEFGECHCADIRYRTPTGDTPTREALDRQLERLAASRRDIKHSNDIPWTMGVAAARDVVRAFDCRALASATAPSGPDVCSYCGVPITEHPLTDACAFGG